jgi:hypothetical protein
VLTGNRRVAPETAELNICAYGNLNIDSYMFDDVEKTNQKLSKTTSKETSKKSHQIIS